jgi:hypothetical protein
MIGVVGLFDEILRALLHRLDGQRDVAMTGHQNDRHVTPLPDDRIQERHAVDARHANVGHDDIRLLAHHLLKGFFRAMKGGD